MLTCKRLGCDASDTQNSCRSQTGWPKVSGRPRPVRDGGCAVNVVVAAIEYFGNIPTDDNLRVLRLHKSY